MSQLIFGTAINCIDGRAQKPVWDWLRSHSNVEYVDLITEPGPDRCLAHGPAETIAAIKNKVWLSVERHESKIIAVAAHHDCLANPVSEAGHAKLINESVRVVHSWGMGARVVGLYVTASLTIHVIADTEENP